MNEPSPEVRAALEKYAPSIWELGRLEGVLAACRTHGPEDNDQKLIWIFEVGEATDDDNPYAGEPFDFEAHDHPERLDV